MCLPLKWVLVGKFWEKLGPYWTHIFVCKGKSGSLNINMHPNGILFYYQWIYILSCEIKNIKNSILENTFSKIHYRFRMFFFINFHDLPLDTRICQLLGLNMHPNPCSKPWFGGKFQFVFTPKVRSGAALFIKGCPLLNTYLCL